jgi:histidine triad (HIT) family protein
MDCIFCKIVNGELPCYKVYEDDDTLAFLDIGPVNYGHALVIPKKHFVNIEDVDEENLCKVAKTVKKIGLALKTGLNTEGYNILENNDPVAGQIVPHLHFHIVPRSVGDNLGLWPQGKYGEGEAEEMLKKIKI